MGLLCRSHKALDIPPSSFPSFLFEFKCDRCQEINKPISHYIQLCTPVNYIYLQYKQNSSDVHPYVATLEAWAGEGKGEEGRMTYL